jgi:hypothetical protein
LDRVWSRAATCRHQRRSGPVIAPDPPLVTPLIYSWRHRLAAVSSLYGRLITGDDVAVTTNPVPAAPRTQRDPSVTQAMVLSGLRCRLDELRLGDERLLIRETNRRVLGSIVVR